MRAIELVHILAGALGLLTGYVALFAGKGSRLHRNVGSWFVRVMLLMTATGLVVTIGRSVAVATNSSAALLTAYLVVTSWMTVRAPERNAAWILPAATLLASGIAVANVRFASLAMAGSPPDGMPLFPFVMFGTVALLGAVGDARVLMKGPSRGAARLARHLWRMTFALFIAALSFFIGQSDEFPEAMRIMPLLGLPVLAVLVTLLYWMWKVRLRKSLRGLTLAATEAAVPLSK